MNKKCLLTLLMLLLAMPIVAGDVQVGLTLAQRTLVLGEPLHVVVTVQNTSGRLLDLPFEPILAGTNPAVVVSAPGGQLLPAPQVGALACEETGMPAISATFSWSFGNASDIKVPAGQTVSFQSQLLLPVALRGKVGMYSLVAHYEAFGRHHGQLGAVIGDSAPSPAPYVCNQCWAGTVDSSPVQLTVEAPTGVDAAAYQAFKGNPLAHPADLLKSFPTSIYAGYALAQSGPGGSLAWSAKWGTLTARQRDDAWYVPQMASPDQQEARRQLVLGNYTAFAQRAQAFLSLHPDFARADLLRKELANALFQLDQRDAAMQQVEALSKMKGPCAEEAQALLQTEKPASQ